MMSEKIIREALVPEDLFGLKPENLKRNYRKLISFVHPDKNHNKSDIIQKEFTKLFQKVKEFKRIADIKIKNKTYGIDLKVTEPEIVPTVIKTKRHEYSLLHSFKNADICNIYECVNEKNKKLVFKSSRLESDNDLVLNEINMIKWIDTKHNDELYSEFYPKILDSFIIKNEKGEKLQTLIIPNYKVEGYISLLDVRNKFNDELNSRHLVWIFKRIMMAIGHLHNAGMVHGALLPPHILIHPINHAIKLIDWSYSIKGNNKIKAISTKYKSFYPLEVLNKKAQGGYTDIYMAAKCMLYLIAGNRGVPKRVSQYFKYCAIPGPHSRPQDAWALHEEFDEAMRDIYGKPKYVELT